MSDFLSRLAARAVADAPRAPRREPSTPAAVTVASRAEPAPATEPPVARALPSAPAVRSEPPEVRVEREIAPEPGERVASSTGREQVVEQSVVAEAAAPRPVSAAEPREPDRQRSVAVPVAAAVPVPAAPIVRRVVESRLERTHTVSTIAADEPPVRVHIGRLEVRANLEQPAPKPPRREPERPQSPTLSDYLRGRRSA
jgi:hypothetical protein